MYPLLFASRFPLLCFDVIAAVHGQHLTGRERRLVACKVDHRSGDFVGCRNAFHWYPFVSRRSELGAVFEFFTREWGLDKPRSDRIDANLRSQICGGGACETVEAAFGGAVRGPVPRSLTPVRRIQPSLRGS